MKPTRIETVLQDLLTTTWPTFLWGPPGVGKSSVVRKIAERNKLSLLDIRASLLDPTDLRGIPTVEDGNARWCPPSFLPSDPKSKGILFFDELNAAPPLVQASLYQLTLDRRVGEYVLPDGWRIIAAGNRAEDASVTFRMPAALANRFIHLDYEVDFEDWRTWAIDRGIHPHVVSFLSTRQELLFNMDNTTRGFPTPRSWEMVSDILETSKDNGSVQDIILGAIGEAATIEFVGYLDNAISEETILKIIANPEKSTLPKKLGDQYALIAYLTANAKDKKILEAAGALLMRLKPELGILLFRNLLQKQPKFALNPNAIAFIKAHKDLIR
ncbi:MoxR family ATPase [Puniceicoccaceae bacterium]|nr:MoxR family ATPase [Puniceicoccaceae bacterium]